MSKSIQDWFAKNGFLITISAWLIYGGIGYGVHTVNMRWIDTRISHIEQADINKIKWQLESNTNSIREQEARDRATQREIADIKAEIGIINTKLDSLSNTAQETLRLIKEQNEPSR